MSDTKSDCTPKRDSATEEDELDAAFKDFARVKPKTSNKEKLQDSTSQTSKSSSSKDISEDAPKEMKWSEDFLAAELQKHLDSFVNGDTSQLDSLLENIMNDPSLGEDTPTSAQDNEDDSSKSLEKKLSETIADLSKSLNDLNTSNLGDRLKENLDGNASSMMPFLEEVMQQFLSKEVLYPVFFDTCSKYPDWLERNKNLPEDEQAKYKNQFLVMRKVVLEFEKESASDTPAIKKARFNTIIELLQEMQKYGSPPEDLVGKDVLPDLSSMSSSEVPGCCVM